MTEIEITEEKFKKLPACDQNWIVLQTFHKQTMACDNRFCSAEKEIDALKARKWLHTGASAIGGFVGGIMAVVGKSVFFK